MTTERLLALAQSAAREPDATHAYERGCLLEDRPVAALHRGAQRLLGGDVGVGVGVAEERGALLLTAATEGELLRATEVLRGAYGAALRTLPVRARLLRTGAGLESPVMGVEVQCRWNHVDSVRRDLQRRGARILAAGAAAGVGEVHATCAADALIGYGRQLQELTRARGRARVWLSHFEPADAEPPPAA